MRFHYLSSHASLCVSLHFAASTPRLWHPNVALLGPANGRFARDPRLTTTANSAWTIVDNHVQRLKYMEKILIQRCTSVCVCGSDTILLEVS